MGLDVFSYSKLSLIDSNLKDSINSATFSINKYFPGRNGSIQEEVPYAFVDCFSFSTSCSNYCAWRTELANLSGYPDNYREAETPEESLPFWELIYFSDSYGTIGTECSVSLAKDFADFQLKAETYSVSDPYTAKSFLKRYEQWRKAFELASNGGAVHFR